MGTTTTVQHTDECVTTIKWGIDDFSIHVSRDDTNISLESGLFDLYKSRLLFYMKFRPIAVKNFFEKNECSISLVSFYLDNEMAVGLTCKFYIENSAGFRIMDRPEEVHIFDKEKCVFKKSIQFDDVFSPKSSYIKDDVIYICCKIKRHKIHETPENFGSNAGLKLFEMHQMEQSGICEVHAGDEKIKLDKSILMMHSDVFTTMFNSGLKEGKTNVIKMNDFRPVVLKSFFESIYAGYVLNADFADDLLALADKYHIEWMKKEAESILAKSLSMKNFYKCLQLATTHCCPFLKDKLLSFAYRVEHFEQIIKSDEWNVFALENKDFANTILDGGLECLKIKTELDIYRLPTKNAAQSSSNRPPNRFFGNIGGLIDKIWW